MIDVIKLFRKNEKLLKFYEKKEKVKFALKMCGIEYFG